jgi:hypothetical protein
MYALKAKRFIHGLYELMYTLARAEAGTDRQQQVVLQSDYFECI